jgi:hypothetical protein
VDAGANDSQEPQDEWASLAQILAGDGELLTSRTRLGRVLRRAVVRLADPSISEAEMRAIRGLTEALDDLSDQ